MDDVINILETTYKEFLEHRKRVSGYNYEFYIKRIIKN